MGVGMPSIAAATHRLQKKRLGSGGIHAVHRVRVSARRRGGDTDEYLGPSRTPSTRTVVLQDSAVDRYRPPRQALLAVDAAFTLARLDRRAPQQRSDKVLAGLHGLVLITSSMGRRRGPRRRRLPPRLAAGRRGAGRIELWILR